MSEDKKKDNPNNSGEESTTEPNPDETLQEVDEDLLKNVNYYDSEIEKHSDEHVERIEARNNKPQFWLANYNEATNIIADPVSVHQSLKLKCWSMRKYEQYRDRQISFNESNCEVNVITSERIIVENLNDFGIGAMFDREEKLAEEFNRIMKITARDNAKKSTEVCSEIAKNIPPETITNESNVSVKTEPEETETKLLESPNDATFTIKPEITKEDEEAIHDNVPVKSEQEEMSTNSDEEPVHETDESIKSETKSETEKLSMHSDEKSVNESNIAVYGSQHSSSKSDEGSDESDLTVKSENMSGKSNEESGNDTDVTMKSEDMSRKSSEEPVYEPNVTPKPEVMSGISDEESVNEINLCMKCEPEDYVPDVNDKPSSKLTEVNKSNDTKILKFFESSLPVKMGSHTKSSENDKEGEVQTCESIPDYENKSPKLEDEKDALISPESNPSRTNKRKHSGYDSSEDKDVKQICIVKPFSYLNSPASDDNQNLDIPNGNLENMDYSAYDQQVPMVIYSDINDVAEEDNVLLYAEDYQSHPQDSILPDSDNESLDESSQSDIDKLSVIATVGRNNTSQLDSQTTRRFVEQVFHFVNVNDLSSEASSSCMSLGDPLELDSNERPNELPTGSDISLSSTDESLTGYEADDEARISRRRRQLQIQQDLAVMHRRYQGAQRRVNEIEEDTPEFPFDGIDDGPEQ